MELSDWRPPTNHALINQFAIRCFRDTGDGDYIAARLAMKARLAAQFLWSAQQAIEKYLKCILMLNRRTTNDLSHNIRRALDRINDELPFKIELRNPEQEIFDHIDEWGGDRYLLLSHHVFDKEVLKLDLLVWHLRQFCEPLDVVHYADEPSEEVLLRNVAAIEARLMGPAKGGHIRGALLEQILANKDHPARPGLIWRNARYCSKPLKFIKFVNNWQAVNAPLYLTPELADQVAMYMKIPKGILSAANALAEHRERTGERG